MKLAQLKSFGFGKADSQNYTAISNLIIRQARLIGFYFSLHMAIL